MRKENPKKFFEFLILLHVCVQFLGDFEGIVKGLFKSFFQNTKKGGRRVNPQEELFCQLYHWMRNGKEAAQGAGFPPEQAQAEAMRLLGLKGVQRRLRRLDKAREESGLENAVIAGLSRIAFGSIGDCVRLLQEGDEAPVEQLDLFSVSEIRRGKDGGMELRLYSRMEALQKLMELAKSQGGQGALEQVYAALTQGAAGEEEL